MNWGIGITILFLAISIVAVIEIIAWIAKPAYYLYPELRQFDRGARKYLILYRYNLRHGRHKKLGYNSARAYIDLLNEHIIHWRLGFWLAFTLFFILNITCLWFSYALIQVPQFIVMPEIEIGIQNAFKALSFWSVLHTSVLAGITGATLDMTSVWITTAILRKALDQKRLSTKTMLISIDLLLAALSCTLATTIAYLSLKMNYINLIDNIRNPMLYFRQDLFESIGANKYIVIVIVILGITSVLPSAVFWALYAFGYAIGKTSLFIQHKSLLQRVLKQVSSGLHKDKTVITTIRDCILWLIAKPGSVATIITAIVWLLLG